jgi:pyruvate formate lyase activating enzyme
VRGTRDGKLCALGYGLVSSANLDPIEKKPLYHFRPGSAIFSIGGWGCNLGCRFCQNWTISQEAPAADGRIQNPARVVDAARKAKSIGVAYTYNEPVVGFEFVMDCAAPARTAGLANVLVTNGYVNQEPARELLALVDAINLDIKSMDDAFYRAQCGGTLEPVLAFAVEAVRFRTHLEITNLVIPGLNDGIGVVRSLAKWIRANLGRGVPLHLSAYYPRYKCDAPATPPSSIERFRKACREELDYVYCGNVVTGEGHDTECPGCGNILVHREGYTTVVRGLKGLSCGSCGRLADLVTSGNASA